jgi:polar amino acid transport system substrate-binding protein
MIRKTLTRILLMFLVIGSVIAYGDHYRLGTASVEPFHNDQMTGVIDKILLEAFSRLGHQLTIVNTPAERSLLNANTGALDGDAFRVAGLTADYQNLIQSTVPLYQIEFSAFARNQIALFVDLQDLQSYRLGIVRGHKILEQKMTGMNVLSVNSPEILFLMLDVQRVDIALINKSIGQAIVSGHSYPEIVVLEPPIISRPMYLYLNNKHQTLLQQIDQELLKMKQQGIF